MGKPEYERELKIKYDKCIIIPKGIVVRNGFKCYNLKN